jgi:hypothetical protein
MWVDRFKRERQVIVEHHFDLRLIMMSTQVCKIKTQTASALVNQENELILVGLV